MNTNLNEAKALEACPFCGQRAKILTIESGENKGGRCVECEGCGASSRLIFPNKCDVTELLRESWNTRAPQPKATGETPRVNAAAFSVAPDDYQRLVVPIDFASQLERENNALQHELSEARAEIARLKAEVPHA